MSDTQSKTVNGESNDKHSDGVNKKLLHVKSPREDLKNWMTNLPQRLCDIPIWKFLIPGSHDSGTYGLTTEWGIAPDRSYYRSIWVRICGCILLPSVYRWTLTQHLDIANQLNAGIRYFDFRVGSMIGTDDLYFVHGLYGPKIADMLQMINNFLIENPKEIVFIDFQHFYKISDYDHKTLIKYMSSLFGHRMVPYASLLMMDKFTLNYLWNKKQQIFIYYRDETARMENPSLWPSRCLPNPWPNTMNTQTLVQFLNNQTNVRPPNSMFVSQGILTPTNKYAAFRFFSSLYRSLVPQCNETISEWINGQSLGPRGPNILITDFIEWDNYRLPKAVIQINMNFLKNP